MGAGQFSIFGAIEEKSGGGFSRSNARERESGRELVGALDGAVFARGVRCGGILEERVGGLSTGSAQEMQKGGGQLPVAGGQLPVSCADLCVATGTT
jgi:hypothetical protein